MTDQGTVVSINNDVDKIRAELAQQEARLKNSGGGGRFSGMSEESLKPRVDFLQTAFLWLAGLFITGLLAIFTAILTVSSGTNGRIDKLTEAVSAMNRENGEQSSKSDDTNRRLDRIEQKIDKIAN